MSITVPIIILLPAGASSEKIQLCWQNPPPAAGQPATITEKTLPSLFFAPAAKLIF
jgi:hypothetical protein